MYMYPVNPTYAVIAMHIKPSFVADFVNTPLFGFVHMKSLKTFFCYNFIILTVFFYYNNSNFHFYV